MNKLIDLQLFAAETNITTTSDLEPAISVDFTSQIAENIDELRKVLGISTLEPMATGTLIKSYKMTKENTPDQVGEGETIGLTKITRKLAWQKEITLKKFRKVATAEAIQKIGKQKAINDTDSKMVSELQKDIKKDFFASLATGTGTAKGTGLQAALANGWGAMEVRFEDLTFDPVFFISPLDVATYLGSAQITTQNAFGFQYIEGFLGLGTAILSPQLAQGTAYGTAKQNLRGAYIPNGGDVASSFGLTFDTTGLIGMTHSPITSNATIETLLMSGVQFWPEYADGVFKITINAASASTGA
ncbi:hypothetical protein EDX97_09565 [Absicoccus porci]|uniref:Phage capsid protein n=1 Tax=Absicoccus porci TaxID=2486576 RepID=A0A3N0I086_9FIRM|nr:hypothetical protein [Absicoccus porci]RNM29860.1 hypothetical protein EDX97_09565 [Absicoccus porci]